MAATYILRSFGSVIIIPVAQTVPPPGVVIQVTFRDGVTNVTFRDGTTQTTFGVVRPQGGKP